ncbi:MAG: histidine kinase, partial [Akkermansia sp.]|nr:histidine kinase [Akkermansia sp.]
YVERNINVLKENAHLAQMLLKEERERMAMENLVTQAELRSLQAQINPHFLFNTLSMISQPLPALYGVWVNL